MRNLPDKMEVIFDKERKFYTEYLLCYEALESSNGLIKANNQIGENFNEFSELYFTPKNCMSDEEVKTYADYVDSFAFYVARGVIISRDDGYFIDLNELLKISENYHKDCKRKSVRSSKRTI